MTEPWTSRLTVGGAGMPLPLAFSAVVEHLLDQGDSDFSALGKIVKDSLFFKEGQVHAGWDSWGSFAGDVVTQLVSAGLVSEDHGVYKVSPYFMAGVKLDVLPGVGITVYEKHAREQRDNNAKALMALRGVIYDNPHMNSAAMGFLREAEMVLAEIVAPAPEPDTRGTRPAYVDAGTPRVRQRKRRRLVLGMSQFFRDYADKTEPGRWFTIKEVAEAWNKQFPDTLIRDSDHAGSMRKAARELLLDGELENRMVVRSYGQRVISNGVLRDVRVQTAEYRKRV